jgi:WD40 repeat protein
MRIHTVEKCKRIRGIHFLPETNHVLVSSSVEAGGVDTLARLDLASGETIHHEPFFGDQYAMDSHCGCVVVSTAAYSASQSSMVLRSGDPHTTPIDWQPIPIRLGWPQGTSAIGVGGLAMTPGGNWLLACLSRRRMVPESQTPEWTEHLLYASTDGLAYSPLLDLDHRYGRLAFAPDGTTWAAAVPIGPRHEIRLYKDFSLATIATARLPPRRIDRLLFSPDGRLLLAVANRTIELLGAKKLERVATIGGKHGQVNGVAFSPDGALLLVGTNDGRVALFDTATARPIESFEWDIGPISAAAFSPDGLLCAAGSTKRRVVVWDRQ